MSAHIRVTALICAASACLALVTGCTSDGAKPSAAGSTTTAPAAGPTTAGASADGSQNTSGDAGCDEVLAAIGTLKANVSDLADPTSAVKAYSSLSTTMLDAATKATKPGAKAAIIKLSNDFTTFATQLAGGAKSPDTSAISADTGAMATACS